MIKLKSIPKVIKTESNCTVHVCPNCYEKDGVVRTTLKFYKSGLGKCFRCNEVFSIDGNKSIIVKQPMMKYIKLSKTQIDEYKNAINYDSKGIQYLKQRNKYLEKDYHLFNIRFSNNSILIPFYINNELVYIQKRTFPEKKYTNMKGVTIPLYLTKQSYERYPEVVISEGVFDAIACHYLFNGILSIGIIGSTISNSQLQMLRKISPSKMTIYLDDLELSNNLKNKLRKEFFSSEIETFHVNGFKDPEVFLNYLIKEEIKIV